MVTADLAAPDPSVPESDVQGADAVLSGLGPRSAADVGITASGTEAVVRAMQATGVRRVVVVSAAPVGTVPSPGRPKPPRHDPGDGFFMRHLFSRVLRASQRTVCRVRESGWRPCHSSPSGSGCSRPRYCLLSTTTTHQGRSAGGCSYGGQAAPAEGPG
ncbi:MAG TPA: NAD(P)H-binding protein [Actinomycetes bacterium]|nr:NAD(P)H-binding protein [Actinomycetes bacterium]